MPPRVFSTQHEVWIKHGGGGAHCTSCVYYYSSTLQQCGVRALLPSYLMLLCAPQATIIGHFCDSCNVPNRWETMHSLPYYLAVIKLITNRAWFTPLARKLANNASNGTYLLVCIIIIDADCELSPSFVVFISNTKNFKKSTTYDYTNTKQVTHYLHSCEFVTLSQLTCSDGLFSFRFHSTLLMAHI